VAVIRGGDTTTKLLDDCQERLGKRSEVLVSSARVLLQLGVQFHRLCHIVTNKKTVEEFDSLNHYRNAASKRSTFKESLRTAQNKLLQAANSYDKNAKELDWSYPMPVEEEDSDEEDAVGKKKSKPKGKGTPVVPLPCAAAAGLTPAHGQSIDNPSEEFKTRCEECVGVYGGNKYKDGKRERKRCHFCSRKGTYSYCYGCRRFLCSDPPLDGKDRKGNEYPKFFSIQVPTKGKGGKKDTTKEERGDLTCYLLAHKKLLSGEALKATMTAGPQTATKVTGCKPAAAVSNKKDFRKPAAAVSNKKASRKSAAAVSNKKASRKSAAAVSNKKASRKSAAAAAPVYYGDQSDEDDSEEESDDEEEVMPKSG